jgi:hypothetical protein
MRKLQLRCQQADCNLFMNCGAQRAIARTVGMAANVRASVLAVGLTIGIAAVAGTSGCQRGTSLDNSSSVDATAQSTDPTSPIASTASNVGANSVGANSVGGGEGVPGGGISGSRKHGQAGLSDERLPPANAAPPVVVQAFLEASRSGQDDLATALLSTKAREATGREGLALDRTGTASMVFEVGVAEFPAEDKLAAYVPSVWREPSSVEPAPTGPASTGPASTGPASPEPASEPTARVTWILRRQADGWRIAGMATATAEGEEPMLINFEDANDLRRIKGDVAGEP